MPKSTAVPSVGYIERAALRHPLRASILALLAMIAIAAIIALAFAALIFVRPSAAALPQAPAISTSSPARSHAAPGAVAVLRPTDAG